MDPYFKRNWTGSRAAGVARGAYHFFRPKVAVTAQTDLFVKTVERLEPGDLPPALDLEAPADWAGIPVNRRVGLAVNWLESVEKQLGATPFVYLSPAFAEETIVDASPLARFPLWVAQYAPAPRIPKPWNRWTMWQHTQKGTVAGIQPALDLNWFQGSEDEFRGMLIGAAKESAPIAG